MTETEWLTCDSPWPLLSHLGGRHLSYRKLHLLSVGFCRRWWADQPDSELQRCATTLERFADGEVDEAFLVAAQFRLATSGHRYAAFFDAIDVGIFDPLIPLDTPLEFVFSVSSEGYRSGDANLLRCLVGNPFHPVALDPAWRTEAVVALGSGIYADRAFDRLPVLADALEDAGCADADILSHCRGPGPHVRGCWVVDLLLGKA
jgi:hypothetical protein